MKNHQFANLTTRRQKLGVGVLAFLTFACLMVAMIGGAGYAGFQRGVNERQQLESQKAKDTFDAEMMDRYARGLDALRKGNPQLAQANLEAALQFQPNNYALREALSTAIVMQTPTVIPQATPLPTLPANVDDVFKTLQAAVDSKQWDVAINAGLRLRENNADYQSELVEDLYFRALIARGAARINRGELEPGLFDLDQASAIRKLDSAMQSTRTIVATYLDASYFYGADWDRAIAKLLQVYAISPRFRDTTQKLNEAYIKSGDALGEAQNWCEAAKRYASALQISQSPSVDQKRVQADQYCLTRPYTGTQTSGVTIGGGILGGQLIFNDGGQWMRTDGTNSATTGNPFSVAGVWATASPDGLRMAYAQTIGGRYSIVIAPTNNPFQGKTLTEGSYPSWGPTNQIAYQGCVNGKCGIQLISPDNASQVRAITANAADINPRWSPNGSELVYVSNYSGSWEVFVVSVNGAVRRVISGMSSIGAPTWSPDGSRIAFQSNYDGAWGVYVVDATGANLRKVAQLSTANTNWQSERMLWTR
jgi:tetratricopeptide (TPR) repeat protein